jgi:hypothetical protein
LEENIKKENPFLQNSSKGSIIIDTFHYGWNQDDINILVEIGGTSQEECRKVIESMIKQ